MRNPVGFLGTVTVGLPVACEEGTALYAHLVLHAMGELRSWFRCYYFG